jgi:hypothetical protein
MPTESYPERTSQNVRDSEATLWFGTTDSPGAKATLDTCLHHMRPFQRLTPGCSLTSANIALWLTVRGVKVLNIAGNRESVNPRIGERVERFLAAVLRRLGHERV